MNFELIRYDRLASTNDTAKKAAREGAAEGVVITALSQSAGRGRADHSFYSPEGGIYMSVILRPRFSDYTLITPAAAVAVCQALCGEGFECGIKWVNDIYVNDKKVCGILTEADVSAGWAVLGIGVNTVYPGSGAPKIAGWLYDKANAEVNCRITNAVLEKFDAIYEGLPDKSFIDLYREKSILKGKDVLIDGVEYAYEGIGDDFSLIVSQKGQRRTVRCGDVSIIPVF